MEYPEVVHGERSPWRPVVVSAIGPLTVLAAIVWAFLQPYRITFLDPDNHGFWDQIAQPQILVAAVGLVFHVAVGRPLVRLLERGS